MRATVIVVILVIFGIIFVAGSVTEPFTGDGMYLAADVQGVEGENHMDAVLVFNPIEGSTQTFDMYFIMYDSADEDAEPYSILKENIKYTGRYFKHIWGPLYLRPTGLHFPVVDFEGDTKFVLSWQLLDMITVDAQGALLENAEVTTASHRSTISQYPDGSMNFDGLPYEKVDSLPENVKQYIELADAAVAATAE